MSEIEYSDGGSIESKIIGILKRSTDLNSLTYVGRSAYGHWPARYHLTPERANLLRHLDFSGCDVLEIGAGMGAISRFLAENAKSLTVLEGTQRRFDALSERLRDLKNWSGHVGNFQDFKSSKKYDVVCVIGVLEYAELYFRNSQNPFQEFLDLAAGFLKDDGVLVLAIENKIGLKYWTGAPEDHTGQYFDGVCDYRESASPRTFSRVELRSMFQKSGFAQIREYYPLPDYKICQSVLSQDFVAAHPELSARFFFNDKAQERDVTEMNLFPESLAATSLGKAGLLGEFANSFLFVGERTPAGPTFQKVQKSYAERGERAWYYSLGRRHGVRTAFRYQQGDQGPQWSVEKNEIGGRGETERKFANTPLIWRCPKDPDEIGVQSGPHLSGRFERLLFFNEWRAFEDELLNFLRWSLQSWRQPSDGLLRPEAVDALWANAVPMKSGSYALFDREWLWTEGVGESWFVFRNICVLQRLQRFLVGKPFKNLAEFYSRVCEELGVKPDLQGSLILESRLQSAIYGTELEETRRTLEYFLHLNVAGRLWQGYFRLPQTMQQFQLLGKLRSVLMRFPGLFKVLRLLKRMVRR